MSDATFYGPDFELLSQQDPDIAGVLLSELKRQQQNLQLIASENPKKPLSDNQLSDMLKEQGIDCARRTVAKYREALRIAPTNLRKAL